MTISYIIIITYIKRWVQAKDIAWKFNLGKNILHWGERSRRLAFW